MDDKSNEKCLQVVGEKDADELPRVAMHEGVMIPETESDEDLKEWQDSVMKLMAVNDISVALRILQQAATAIGKKASSASDVNELMAFIAELKPKSSMETLLIIQMLAMHNCTTRLLGQVNSAHAVSNAQQNMNLAIKAQKTFMQQMDVLLKSRRGGKQRIVVEKVNVESGGQAVVGNIESSPCTKKNKE